LIEDSDPLVEALNGFSPAYRDALAAAMIGRLGLKSASPQADVALANLAFRAIGEGGEALRWEPFFFDWFGGAASQARALGGPRAGLYGGAAFKALRAGLEDYAMDRPERLEHPYFAGGEPEELLYPENEAIWGAIADGDDWSAFGDKIKRIGIARDAMRLA
jgi:uncharacterized protein YdiU (UPF0061 family)